MLLPQDKKGIKKPLPCCGTSHTRFRRCSAAFDVDNGAMDRASRHRRPSIPIFRASTTTTTAVHVLHLTVFMKFSYSCYHN